MPLLGAALSISYIHFYAVPPTIVRTRHYSVRTDEAYIRWISECILFFDKRHPPELECVRLRVKDVDFARLQITVREGKGDKDRVTMLPPSLVVHLQRRLERARALYELDVREG